MVFVAGMVYGCIYFDILSRFSTHQTPAFWHCKQPYNLTIHTHLAPRTYYISNTPDEMNICIYFNRRHSIWFQQCDKGTVYDAGIYSQIWFAYKFLWLCILNAKLSAYWMPSQSCFNINERTNKNGNGIIPAVMFFYCFSFWSYFFLLFSTFSLQLFFMLNAAYQHIVRSICWGIICTIYWTPAHRIFGRDSFT